MTIIGIDPAVAKQDAYSVWVEGMLSMVGKLRVPGDLTSVLFDWDVDLIVIEDQYMFKNFNSAKKLTWHSGFLAGIGHQSGVKTEIMNVASWMSYVGARKQEDIVPIAEGITKSEICLLEQVEMDSDIAAAILIPKKFVDAKY